jgi:hypothetical protein
MFSINHYLGNALDNLLEVQKQEESLSYEQKTDLDNAVVRILNILATVEDSEIEVISTFDPDAINEILELY